MIGKNNFETINDIDETFLQLPLNETHKMPTDEEHLKLMRLLMLDTAKLIEPWLKSHQELKYEETLDFLRKQACGTNQYSYQTYNDYRIKRQIFSYYTYVGSQSNRYTIDFDITYLKKQYVWFAEKYLIPQKSVIESRTILHFAVNRPLTNHEMAQNQLSVSLDKYIGVSGELYHRVQGKQSIESRLKNQEIFDISSERWLKNERTRSDTIRLKSYLVYLEQKYGIQITDVLKKHNIRHTILADHSYNLGDLYAKMLYDLSLALDFDFLVDTHNCIVGAESMWLNCMRDALCLLMDLQPIDTKAFCQQLRIILSFTNSQSNNTGEQTLTVLEGFYTMLSCDDRAYFHKGILEIEEQISKLPDTIFSEKITDVSFMNPIDNAKSDDYAAVKEYILNEHLSIRNFVFSEKQDRKTKKKWVRDNIKAVINILKILDAHEQLSEVTPYLIYICFKLYNDLDKSIHSVPAIYDANTSIYATKYDINNYSTNIYNQIYLINRLNKYLADHGEKTEQFKSCCEVSMMIRSSMIKCFELKSPITISQHTQSYCQKVNDLIETYRRNGWCSNKHLPIVGCSNNSDNTNIKVIVSHENDIT
ncbi:MAG: hypothetical protein IJZ95_07160 [Oscillospiraceae bacterium]|nr:hypothetical protein [Oscillospiraceae bacterium]